MMEALADYWTFFSVTLELGVRSALLSLTGLLPRLATPEAAGLWAVGLLYLAEGIVPWRPQQPRLREGVWLDLFYTLGSFLLFYQLIGNPIFQTVEIGFRETLHDVFGLKLEAVVSFASMHPWLQYLLMFLLVDLLSYLGHVLLHRVDWLWALHRVHHSARQLDTLNAVRQHWAEKLYYDFLVYVPLALIGFGVEQAAVVRLISLGFCTFTHSNIKVPLGPLRYVFNNPQLHLWHHARVIPHNRNVNYGSALSMWDYLFRTSYLPDDRAELELGFEGDEDFPTTFVRQQLHPFDRWLPKPTAWRRSLGRAVAGSLTACALSLIAFGSVLPDWVLAPVGIRYRERGTAAFEQGDPSRALSILARGALIDADDFAALRRLLARSESASFTAPAVKSLLAIGRGDAELRFRAGQAWLRTVRGDAAAASLSDALENAEALVAAEPRRARSHALHGETLLVAAAHGGGREALDAAVTAFGEAIARNPSYPGAREGRAEARARLERVS